MRLLHTVNYRFQEFMSERQTPTYAILSHRWEADEVGFKDWRKGRITRGQGYDKILRCCQFARKYGYVWVWIDTCCIDKRSSAELTEAINSMYKWYKQAGLCIVYLSDVDFAQNLPLQGKEWDAAKMQMETSQWFTRGWTLQELLAPDHLLFCSTQWAEIGRIGLRYDLRSTSLEHFPDLADLVSKTTGIDSLIFTSRKETRHVHGQSVAKRMSWAAKRQTTRTEDKAYCLLGIFEVNMPLLYGEGGDKAFLRLQLEIIKRSADESIFAWRASDDYHWYGVLARSPSAFTKSSFITSLTDDRGERESVIAEDNNGDEHDRDRSEHFEPRLPYLMTHRGLELRARAWTSRADPDLYHIPLGCQDHKENLPQCIIAVRGEARDRDEFRIRQVYRFKTTDLGRSLASKGHFYTWKRLVKHRDLKDVGVRCFEIPQEGL